jgi:hypothetical protein
MKTLDEAVKSALLVNSRDIQSGAAQTALASVVEVNQDVQQSGPAKALIGTMLHTYRAIWADKLAKSSHLNGEDLTAFGMSLFSAGVRVGIEMEKTEL